MDSSTSPAPNGVIIDTNVLSIFAKIGRLDLLQMLFRAAHSGVGLYLTPTILAEVHNGIGHGVFYLSEVLELIESERLLVLAPNAADKQYMAALPAKLGIGEAEAIALCHRLGIIFLTHDRKAMNFCEREGIKCLPLVKLLDRLQKANRLTEAELQKMLSS